jgi:DNA-binding transcriptional ArsR family regulator
MLHADPVDAVFHALAHATRRAVVARLGHGPASATELAAPFDMALPSFCQHLQVLERSGVVRSHKRGRVRTYALNPEALAVGEHWLTTQRSLWSKRLDQLDAFLIHLPESP